MTCIERLRLEHPEEIDCTGSTKTCPEAYGYARRFEECKYTELMSDAEKDKLCQRCWERECDPSIPPAPCKIGDYVYTPLAKSVSEDKVRAMRINNNNRWEVLALHLQMYQVVGIETYITPEEAKAVHMKAFENHNKYKKEI